MMKLTLWWSGLKKIRYRLKKKANKRYLAFFMVSGLGVFGAHLIGTALHDDLPMFQPDGLVTKTLDLFCGMGYK